MHAHLCLCYLLFFWLEICGKEDVSPRKDCSTLPAATSASPQQTTPSLQPTITSPDGTQHACYISYI